MNSFLPGYRGPCDAFAYLSPLCVIFFIFLHIILFSPSFYTLNVFPMLDIVVLICEKFMFSVRGACSQPNNENTHSKFQRMDH